MSSYNVEPGKLKTISQTALRLKSRYDLGSFIKMHPCKMEGCAAGLLLYLLSRTVMEAFDFVCAHSGGPSETEVMS